MRKINSVIAIDFDGTVVDHAFPKIGQTAPHAVEVLKRLVENKYKLILYTMRSGLDLSEAIRWFHVNNIPLWGIQFNPTQSTWTTSNKCFAHIYIDNSNLGCPLIHPEGFLQPCVDWKKVEQILITE